jgi:hypothetical protein
LKNWSFEMTYPKYGTELIKCSKRKCTWRGYETEMGRGAKGECQCPVCGNSSYYFLSEKEKSQFEKVKS